MNYVIRKATHQDAKAIILVHATSIKEICAKDYSETEIKAWSNFLKKESIWCQRMDRDYIWVLEVENEVSGFVHLAIMNEELGEVMGLYILPGVKGKGLGKKLINTVFNKASELGLKSLTLLSTRTAKTFYEKVGFLQNEGDSTVEIEGVHIACHPMMYEFT